MTQVINLYTGELEEVASVQQTVESEPQKSPDQSQIKGGIIDLSTGGIIEPGGVQDSAQAPLPEANISSEGLPEVGAAEELNELSIPSFLTSVGLLATGDVESAQGVLRNQFPTAEFIKSSDGEELIVLPSGTYRVRGLGQTMIGITAQLAPFMKGARVASGLTQAASLPAKVAAQAGMAGGIQAGIEGVEGVLGGGADVGEVPFAAALGAAGEFVIPAINAFRQARQARLAKKELGVSGEEMTSKVIPTEAAAAEAQAGLKEASGVEVGLFPAQKTLIPSELQKQRILPQLEAGSRKAFDALSTQNEEVFEATTQLIERIVPKGQAVNAEQRIRNAAAQFGEILENNRKQAFDQSFLPALQDAVDRNLKVPIKNIESTISSVAGGHRPGSPVGRLMRELSDGLKEADREIIDGSNMLALHNFKQEIGQKVTAFEGRQGPLDKKIKAGVAQIYDSVTSSIRASSPLYDDAMEAFIAKTPEIDAFQASLAGRTANLTDSELLGITAKIFDRRVSPEDIRQAKSVIESVDPGAWSAIVSKEIQNRVGGIVALASEQGADVIPNMPGQLKAAIFGNPRQRQVLLRALNNEQRQNFKWLETTLSRAAAGRAQGSPTASFTEIISNMRGRLGVLKDVLTRPMQTLQETGDTTLFNRRVSALTEAMFDPKWTARVEKIKNLSPGSDAAARAMLQLVNDIEAGGEDE